jgi:hypothetical protein
MLSQKAQDFAEANCQWLGQSLPCKPQKQAQSYMKHHPPPNHLCMRWQRAQRLAVDDYESNQKLKHGDLRPFHKMQKHRQISVLETHQPVSTISPAKSRHFSQRVYPKKFNAKQPINIFAPYP